MIILKKRLKIVFFIIVLLNFLWLNSFFFNKSENVITVGSKNCTESHILAEIISILIEKNTNLKVKRTFNLEGSFICFEALLSKSIDLYPEYSGTILSGFLKEDIQQEKDRGFEYINKGLQDYNIVFSYPLGFENSYVIIMKKSKAVNNNICSISDLDNQKFSMAVDPEFIIRDDFKILKNEYKLSLNYKMLDQSLIYISLNNGSIDTASAYATDSKITKYDFLTLSDDKKFFPAYDAAIAIRKDIIKKYPQLSNVLQKIEKKITNEKMKHMNYLQEEKHQNVYDIAYGFLKLEKLI